MTFSFQHSYYPQENTIVLLPVFQEDLTSAAIHQLLDKLQVPELFRKEFTGDFMETAIHISISPEIKICFIGLGQKKSLHQQQIIKAFRSVIHKQKSKLGTSVSLVLEHWEIAGGLPLTEFVTNALVGVELGLYDIQLHKTSEKKESLLKNGTLTIWSGISAEVGATIAFKADQTAQALKRTMDLVNQPSNFKTPAQIVEQTLVNANAHGYVATVLDKKALEANGLQALLAVNKGSKEPPFLLVLEYKGSDVPGLKKIGLVGKGVTFDTGGISIKQSTNMHLMKSDMGGAAAVIGAVDLAARLKMPVHVCAAIPLTENCVDGLSTLPGEVIGSYAGKTIEVIDTDAEGRLILADALSWLIKNHGPDAIIDLATLTGNSVLALGYLGAVLFTNNESLNEDLIKASEKSGERLWRFPLWEEYGKEMESDIADIKNLATKPVAGAITAAKFLEYFVQPHAAWAHIDIAGVALTDSEFSSQRSATAYGVLLLQQYLQLQTTQ